MKKLCIALVLLIVLTTSVYGADPLYRFMHNDHDVLVIGRIIKQYEYSMHDIEVSEIIISDKSMSNKEQHINLPKVISVYAEVYGTYTVGDNVAVSLNKYGSKYRLANGMYKLTTSDTNTLEVINFNDSFLPEDNASVEVFLRSRGKCTNFSFNENGVYLNKNILIYDKINKEKFYVELNDINNKILVEGNISRNNHKYKDILIVIFISLVVMFHYNKSKNI